MKHRISKFILASLSHATLLFLVDFVVFNLLILKAGQEGAGSFVVMIHIFFCAGYFFLLYLKLYDFDYNYFLRFSRDIIVRSLVTMVALMLAAIALFYLIMYLLAPIRPADFLYPPERFFTIAVVIITCDIAGLLVLYAVQYFWILHLITLGYLKKNVLVVGEPDDRFPLSGIEQGNLTKNFQGTLFRRGSLWYFRDSGAAIRVLCQKDIPNLLFEQKIGEVVIFLCASISQKDVDRIISYLSENSINYYLVPDIAKLSHDTFKANSFPYVPIIRKYITKRDSVTQVSLKRFLDILLVSLALLLLAPLGFIIALLIKLGDGGPVFYTHERVGKNGKIINFIKFRTMVAGADSLKEKLLPFNQRGDGPLFKMKDDPRITRAGKMIRRWSLDELPQLLNVLKGDISLVGPRPHLVTEVNKYGERDMLRLDCIPGITCLPQVFGRNTASFREWIELDLAYRKHWSIALDLRILVRSLNEVISPLYRDSFRKS